MRSKNYSMHSLSSRFGRYRANIQYDLFPSDNSSDDNVNEFVYVAESYPRDFAKIEQCLSLGDMLFLGIIHALYGSVEHGMIMVIMNMMLTTTGLVD